MNGANNNVILNNEVGFKKKRETGIELFRIITMILIIAHHYVVNSGLTSAGGVIYSNPNSLRSIFLLIFGAWGKTGINCFVIITGYFMCKSNITFKKFAKLYFEVLFYNCIIYAVFVLSGYESFSFVVFLKTLIPVSQVKQNFTGCYLLFFLTIPFINILIHNMNAKQHGLLVVLLMFIYVFFGTVKILGVDMNYVSWFIVLYLVASYIRLYPRKIFCSLRFWGILSSVSIFLSILSVVVCQLIGQKISKPLLGYYFLIDSNTFLAFTNALCSFMFFKNLKLKHNRFINSVASCTFGVFLIHANSDAMRRFLWCDLLNNVNMYYSPYLIVHAVISVIGIFVLCAALDYLRAVFIEKPLFKKLDKQFEQLTNWLEKKEVFGRKAKEE